MNIQIDSLAFILSMGAPAPQFQPEESVFGNDIENVALIIP
jgi:hypothetical protein